jgi:undecaprenyl-diphosphatase
MHDRQGRRGIHHVELRNAGRQQVRSEHGALDLPQESRRGAVTGGRAGRTARVKQASLRSHPDSRPCSRMDLSIVEALNGFLVRHDGLEDPWMLYVRASEALFLALVVGLFLLGGRRLQRAAVAAAASAGLALAAAVGLSIAVARARPFASDPSHVRLLIPHAADAGFPSDHATAAFAIATALLVRDRRYGLPTLVLAFLLAAGRVAAGVHFPSDVLAGAALGALVALILTTPHPRRLLTAVADRLGAVLDIVRAPLMRSRAAGG